MSSEKQPGTLRDFNISGQFNSASSSTGSTRSSSVSASTAKTPVPSQSVKSRAMPSTPSRQPNLTEWEDPNKFWSSWEQDLETNMPARRTHVPTSVSKTPAAKPAPMAKASTPAAAAKAAPVASKGKLAVAPVNTNSARPSSVTAPVAPVRQAVAPVRPASAPAPVRQAPAPAVRQQVAAAAPAPIAAQPVAALSNLNDTRNPHEPVELEDVQGQLQSEDQGSTPWAVELALQERRAERMGVVDFANAYQKQEMLKKMTLEFMSQLRKQFQEQIEVFNESRRNPAQNVQLYRVSNTAEDFMIFRNSVKLVVSGQRAGRIVFGFNQFLGQIFAPRTPNTFEIEASWGAFDQLHWNYRGERVQAIEIARYFLTEFSRQSFR